MSIAPDDKAVITMVVLILGLSCAAGAWFIGIEDKQRAQAVVDTTLQARSEERARCFVSSLGLRAAGVVCSSHRHHLPNGPVACTAGTESGTVLELSCDPDLPLTERGAPCSLARSAP